MSPQRKKAEPRGRRRPRPGAIGRGVPAVFLDRDGTITEEVGYVNHVSRLQLYPWSADAVRKLNRADWPVIVVTNQSGVARGYFSEELIREVHQKMSRELAAQGARVDGIYYCPHHPTGQVQAYRVDCRCRKPLIGMLEEAAQRFFIDLGSSYVVGDGYRDMQLGFNAGARTILVLTGYGLGEYEHHRHGWPRQPDWIAENLLEAVDIILGAAARRSAGARRSSLGSRPL